MYTVYCIHTYALLYIFTYTHIEFPTRSDEALNTTTATYCNALNSFERQSKLSWCFWGGFGILRDTGPNILLKGIFGDSKAPVPKAALESHRSIPIAGIDSFRFHPLLWVLNLDMSASLMVVAHLPICRSSQSGAVWLKPLEVLGRIGRARQVELKGV